MTNPDAKQRDRFVSRSYPDRSPLQDCTELEIVSKINTSFFSSHSLCINCSDYYQVPPCLTSDFSCFPSFVDTDPN